jgi:hypothetical protein
MNTYGPNHISVTGDEIRIMLPRNEHRVGDLVPFKWSDGTPAIAKLKQVTTSNHTFDWWRFADIEPEPETTQEEQPVETTGEPTRRYRLLARFYDDHCSRDLPGGTVVSRRKNEVTVELNAAEYTEMLSDARYYSDRSMFEWEQQYLCSSAEGTARRLEKTGPPA